MSPEALIGMELGKSVLQRLLGQGTMGAVYLASQADRQVAVKVFLPASALEQADHEEFLQSLEKAIARGAALDHAHILPILNHGREKGFVYQIMPYVAGESLEMFLTHAGKLPFVQIQSYLEQIAAALDYAHARGVLHCDIKPTNVLLASTDNLLLSDFGLANLTIEKNFASTRRAVSGMLNAIAPEYVLGQTIDQRADLYSLGAVLYQMVTGSPPFKGNSLSEVAMKHIKAVPPSPRSLRTDLPQAAEQVMLRALAKRPADRYSHARDLATAFRLALETVQPLSATDERSGALGALAELASNTKTTTLTPLPRTGGLFDPKWQTSVSLPTPASNEQANAAGIASTSEPSLSGYPVTAALSAEDQPTDKIPPVQMDSTSTSEQNNAGTQQPFSPIQASASAIQQEESIGSAKRTGFLGVTRLQANEADQPFAQNPVLAEPVADGSLQLASKFGENTEELREIASPPTSPTGMLSALAGVPGNGDGTGAIKLTEPVRIVQVPVAGQPGRFMTGFLPTIPTEQTAETTPKRSRKKMKIISLLLVVLVIIAGSGAFLVTRSHTNAPATKLKTQIMPDLNASATAQATATVGANIILADPLNQNIHEWPQGSQGWYTCTFQDGAYHIANHDKTKSAPVLLPNKPINGPFVYTLTMEQIKGDQTSLNNQFGMILYATVQNTQGKQIDKFYAFEILNKAGGQYQFWKYDNSKNASNPWNMLWSKNLGKEFKQGSGPSHVNTVTILAKDKKFTFTVNGKQVGTWKDGSFYSGSVGMLVNLNGAEVAFSNLLLTYS